MGVDKEPSEARVCQFKARNGVEEAVGTVDVDASRFKTVLPLGRFLRHEFQPIHVQLRSKTALGLAFGSAFFADNSCASVFPMALEPSGLCAHIQSIIIHITLYIAWLGPCLHGQAAGGCSPRSLLLQHKTFRNL